MSLTDHCYICICLALNMIEFFMSAVKVLLVLSSTNEIILESNENNFSEHLMDFRIRN